MVGAAGFPDDAQSQATDALEHGVRISHAGYHEDGVCFLGIRGGKLIADFAPSEVGIFRARALESFALGPYAQIRIFDLRRKLPKDFFPRSARRHREDLDR